MLKNKNKPQNKTPYPAGMQTGIGRESALKYFKNKLR
jgi:hypothetical protein